MTESILFIDDELNIIDGLKRLLRSKRSEWEMIFLTNPQEGLETMRQRVFDVVVSDMRMPEMDGAEFLEKVKEICPNSVRIILSGQAELSLILKSLGSIHQYLAKPCDPDLLKITIEKASVLRKALSNKQLANFISKIHSLPSDPQVYECVESELNSDSPSIEKIGNIAASDIAMSAKLLQLANSCLFGQKRDVYSVHEAVSLLGIDIIRTLFATGEVFVKGQSSIGPMDLTRLHKRGKAIGNFALRLAKVECQEQRRAEMCASSALLCRIGCILLALFDPTQYSEVLKLGEENEKAVEKEIELFNTSHSEAGAYLLSLWGLPEEIIEAALHHHENKVCCSSKFTALTAIQISETLASACHFQNGEVLDNYEALFSFQVVNRKSHEL